MLAQGAPFMTSPTQARRRVVGRYRIARVALVLAVLGATVAVVTSSASAALTQHQRQIAVGSNAVSASTFSLTVPAGVSTVVGRHLVVAYMFSVAGTNEVTAITDTRGNAYTINVVKKNSGTTGLTVVVASAKITTALVEGDQVTVTQNAITTYHLLQVYEFDNFDPTSWVDKSATRSASGTAVSTAATATTAQPNETLFAAVGFGDTTATLTSASGWTDSGAVEASGTKIKGLATAVNDVAATGAYAYSGGLSASEQWVAVLVTFKTVSLPSSPPTASFSAAPTSGTAPLTVQFTDTSTGGPTAWAWDFGDGSSSTAQNPSHSYAAAGTFTVALTASNAGGSDTATQTGLISVSSPLPSPPTASFSAAPTSGTAPLTVQFTDTSTGGPTAWAWDFGDGSSSTAQNPSHSYATAGTFTVALTASNAGGSDTATQTGLISVSSPLPSPPTASFSAAPTSGTAPLTVQFTDTSTGGPTAWAWDFGDGSSSTAQNPSHSYATAGTFTVALTASNAGGSDTATQ